MKNCLVIVQTSTFTTKNSKSQVSGLNILLKAAFMDTINVSKTKPHTVQILHLHYFKLR